MKKKILVLSSSYPLFAEDINGAFVHELSKRLCEEFDVYVLAPHKKGFQKSEVIDRVHIFRYPQFFWDIDLAYGIGMNENLKKNPLLYFALPVVFLFQFLWIRKICKQECIKLIHAHWLIPNAFVAVLYKLFNSEVKILTTIHGSDFWGLNNSIGNFIKRFTLKRITALTVVSEALKKSVQSFGYKNEITVCPMGINTSKFSPRKEGFVISKNEVQILFVGIVVETKGIRLLIDAMPEIIKAYPHCKLLVVGDGVLRQEMERRVIQLGIENNVKFTGALPQAKLPELYANADLFILPSFSEGWPVVVMEAMSSGATCLVSDIPVFKSLDVINHLLFTFELSKPETLAERAIELLKNRRLETSAHIREYAVENFDWEIISKKYTSLLKQLQQW